MNERFDITFAHFFFEATELVIIYLNLITLRWRCLLQITFL